MENTTTLEGLESASVESFFLDSDALSPTTTTIVEDKQDTSLLVQESVITATTAVVQEAEQESTKINSTTSQAEEEEEEEEEHVGHRNKKVDVEDESELNGSIDKSIDAEDDNNKETIVESSTSTTTTTTTTAVVENTTEEDIFGSDKEEEEDEDKPKFTRLSKRREKRVEKVQDNDDDLDLDEESEEEDNNKKKKKKDKDGDYVVENQSEEEEEEEKNSSDEDKKKKKKKSKKEKKEKKSSSSDKKEKKRKQSQDKEPKKKKERSSKKKKDDSMMIIDDEGDDNNNNNSSNAKESDPLQEVLDSLKHRRATKLDIEDIKNMSMEIIDKMIDAAERDTEANRKRQPALNKVVLLAEVERILSKVQLYDFLCYDAKPSIFVVISQWLDPLPDGSQPNLKIKTALLRILTLLPANRDAIRGTSIVRFIQAVQNNDNESPLIRKLAYDAMHKWSAPGDSSREDSRYDEVEVDMDAVKRAAADEGLTKKFTKEDYLPKHIKHAGFIPRSMTNYTVRPKGLDPKSNIAISSPLRTINRIDREIEKKRLKQPARGSPRAHNVSIEGRGLNLM
ncbi:IWS1 family protein [Cavenderia fasciculata]|uniref:IWS1 family protein n=1 Tax=Cavenderia fasciculata TaxID=261658 RepID=F4Q3U4_CACFS|nr:IWS1 family protein [Cavenderia fasciculata]EGG17700.1 IWS1 family protein [Cavenderia fasciculata]|eukprot:XP_004356184.1 IWS1 family protein [Cavenderia fasciculata]